MSSGQQSNASIGGPQPLVVNTRQLQDAFSNALKEQAKSGIGSWFGVLFTTGSTLGSFFAGFTLSIVSSTANSKEDNDIEARGHAAISSLLFVFTVLVCSGCSLAYAFHKDEFDKKINQNEGEQGEGFTKIQIAVSVLSLMTQGIVLTAVLFFFLVLRAYAWTAGTIGISFTSVAMAVAFVVWVLQFFVKRERQEAPAAQAD